MSASSTVAYSQAVSFLCCLAYLSFFEWTLHRYVLHSKFFLVSYPYRLHQEIHHGLFGHDETFHALDENMRSHITFVARDYILLTLVNAPIYALAEWLCGRPIFFGCLAATLAYLQAFNSLHLAFHVPANSWLQRRRWFLWLKKHHRIHHRRHDRNLNVVVPLADLMLGTMEK